MARKTWSNASSSPSNARRLFLRGVATGMQIPPDRCAALIDVCAREPLPEPALARLFLARFVAQASRGEI